MLNSLLQGTQEQLAEDAYHLSQAIQHYLGKLSTLSEYPFSYEQVDLIPALLKAADFHVDLMDMPIIEALCEHISLIHGILKNQCFVLINAHSFFSADELAQLYSMMQYRKIPLLLLESHAVIPIETEEIRLYDQDLCELRLEELS